MNNNIKQALEYAAGIMPTKKIRNSQFVTLFWSEKDFTWVNLCDFVAGTRSTKVAIAMLVYMLENNLYNDAYKEKLLEDLPYLKQSLEHFTPCCPLVFSKNYDEVHYFNCKSLDNDENRFCIRLLAKGNQVLTDLYMLYLSEHIYIDKTGLNVDINYHFPLSAENCTIKSYKDINSNVFWVQIAYYKKHYAEDKRSLDLSLKNMCRFYRWLVKKYNDYDFFQNSSTLTNELLFSRTLTIHIKEDAYFTTFSPTEDLGDKKIICFIIRNMNRLSTRVYKNSFCVLRTCEITTSYYRMLINRFFQEAFSPSTIKIEGSFNTPIHILHFIENVKLQPDYPNSNIKHFNTNEGVLIRNYILQTGKSLNLTSLNNKIGHIRRFLTWCKKSNLLFFDDTFFDMLSQFEEPNKFQGKAIPDEDIKKINEQFIDLCSKDNTIKPYYAIFLILIETEFRVSQVCNLTVAAIQSTLKNDQYYLCSNTKTSNGRKTHQPICASTAKILTGVITDTENLRNEVICESYQDHIFLYKSVMGKTVKCVNASHFLKVFQSVCEQAEVPKYHSRNLRDTHMTKAFEFILRNGRSDLEMGLISKHKNIDTTKNHYIEMNITKMLESTYEVTLEDRDINAYNRILDDLPIAFSDKDSITEHDCGHCTAKTCTITGSLPCLTCKNFITTIKHKQYFIRMIKSFDELISKTTIRHEIEDLNYIKRLYISWLREICIKEEEQECLTQE